MNANVIIKKPSDGTTRLNAQIGIGSKRYYMLMEHDYLTLKFSTDTPILLHLGDYVEIENVGRYELTAPTRGEFNANTNGYDYEIRLEAQYWKFKNKLCKFLPQIGSHETSWTYTDTLPNHAQHILFNIRALAYKRNNDGKEILMDDRKNFLYNGKYDWRVEWDESVDTTKAVTIQYESKNIIDSIADIAEAYECEWWFKKNVLHFGKCEYGTSPVNLEMGKELVAITPNDSTETYATRIYAYGSDRNIASTYRKSLVFDAEVTNGLLHDPARELEMRYFKNNEIGVKRGNADTQCVYDIYPVSALKKTLEYHSNIGTVNGAQAGNLHIFKLETHNCNAYDFEMEGERKSVTVGNITHTWLPMKKPYLVLSTFRLTATPITQDNVTKAITPKHLTAFFRLVITYYSGDEESGHRMTENTAYHTICAKGVWQGVNKPVNFRFEDQYLAIPTDKIKKVVIENNSQINFAIWYDESGANLGYVYDNHPTITISIEAFGQIGLFDGWPEFSASGITIEVMDKTTGEVNHTIEGATFNANFATSERKLSLPQGADITSGDKYRLPQLNNALVPARYFTSIYTVFDENQDVTTNGIVNNRLLLPEVDEEGNQLNGYLDAFDFESEEEAVEDVVIFEDVYPSRISKIISIQQTDEYTEEQPEQDGSMTPINYREYIYEDDLFSDANQFQRGTYLIDGASLQVTFQSGLLNGMTFDVKLLEDNYHFQIKRDDTTKLPNDIIKPAIGDEFILHGFNIAMLNDSNIDYTGAAEKELLRKTREYIADLNTDANIHQCTVACDVAYKTDKDNPDDLFLGIGRSVNIIHPGYFKNGRISRVMGYEIPLDFAYDNPIYFIGEKAKYSRIGAIEDKLDEVVNASGNFGAALRNALTADYATEAALASVAEDLTEDSPVRTQFAYKDRDDEILHTWQFHTSQQSLNYNADALGSGWWLGLEGDGLSRLVVDRLYVRYKAIFDALEIRHISQVGGVNVLSPAGGVFTSVEQAQTYLKGLTLCDSSGKELRDANGAVLSVADEDSLTDVWRCRLRTDDGEQTVTNDFALGDLVQCRTFNLATSQRFYWRRCVGVGADYIDLSMTDCADGSDTPMAGDSVVTLGNAIDTARQGAISLAAYGDGAPSITLYQGIGTYSTAGCDKTLISPYGSHFTGDFVVNTQSGEIPLAQFLADRISLSVTNPGQSLVVDNATATDIADGGSNPEETYIDFRSAAFAAMPAGSRIALEVDINYDPQMQDVTVELSEQYGFTPISDTVAAAATMRFETTLEKSPGQNTLDGGQDPAQTIFDLYVSLPWEQVIGWRIYALPLAAGLKDTGIDIEAGRITLKGDTEIITNDGSTAALFREGKIKAEYVEADELTATRVQTAPASDTAKAHTLIAAGRQVYYDDEGNVRLLVHSGELSDDNAAAQDGVYMPQLSVTISEDERAAAVEIVGNAALSATSQLDLTDVSILLTATFVQGSASLPDFGDGAYYGNIQLSLYDECGDERTLIAAKSVSIPGTGTFSASFADFGKVVLASGTHSLIIEARLNTALSLQGTWGLYAPAKTLPLAALNTATEIAADGAALRASESFVKVLSSGIVAKAGDYALRISVNGIEASRDGGSSWEEIFT